MKTDKHKRVSRAAEVTSFGGIDASSPNGDGGLARDIQNFKVLADGSLALREGFATLAAPGAPIRGVWVGREGAETFLLAVAGAIFCRISSTGEVTRAVMPGGDGGAVCFFAYDGQVYLLDGKDAYRYAGGVALESFRGYVPLYGKGWNPASLTNPIHEPINLLCDRIRITYHTSAAYSRICVGIPLSSVEEVIVDGKPLTKQSYQLSEDGTVIQLTTLFTTKEDVEVYATLDASLWRSEYLSSCTEVATYESFDGTRVFLYGGADASRLFVTKPVDSASLAAARKKEPLATALYVPRGTEHSVGNRRPITAVVPVDDRMMVCTDRETFLSERMTEAQDAWSIPMRSLSGTVGCRAMGGVTRVDRGAPVTVSAGGLYRWEVDPDPDLPCAVTCISAPIAPLLGADAFTRGRLFYEQARSTLWFFVPDNAEGRVFLYDCATRIWYAYVGIPAHGFFDTGAEMGFFGGSEICLFDPTRTTDLCAFGEREIGGLYESRRMDFGDCESLKRMARVYVEADVGGGTLSVRLSDGRLLDECLFEGCEEGPECYEAHLRAHRFKRLSVTLRAGGGSAQRVYGFCVHAV